jgi:hypothetical protein
VPYSRPAGKEFVAVAERMLNDLRISVRSMREISEEQRGQISWRVTRQFADVGAKMNSKKRPGGDLSRLASPHLHLSALRRPSKSISESQPFGCHFALNGARTLIVCNCRLVQTMRRVTRVLLVLFLFWDRHDFPRWAP